MASTTLNNEKLADQDANVRSEKVNTVEQEIPTTGNNTISTIVPEENKLGAKPKQVKALKIATKSKTKRNPLRTVRKRKDFHCGKCDERDTSRMVLCDQCEVWYHYSCVEVTPSVADQTNWKCPLCETITSKSKPANKEKTIVVQNPETKPDDHDEVKSIRSSIISSSSTRRIAELRLKKLKALTELKQHYVEQKFLILEEAALEEGTVDDRSEIDKLSAIESWIDKTNLGRSESVLIAGSDPIEEINLPKINQLQINPAPSRNKNAYVPHEFNPEKRSTPLAEVARNRDRDIHSVGTISISKQSKDEVPTNLQHSL
ncbi:uncharacterized protein LOC129759849 [Uranotaenia lowii]|uniref:uncharacterized protein LOC129759849 n=1 Tax=Uranotaenia lowii TaxID=190385 RepID=UPI00247A6408|nr:uncharacterized protein LOC129759849 [Uranotaenia lowii]